MSVRQDSDPGGLLGAMAPQTTMLPIANSSVQKLFTLNRQLRLLREPRIGHSCFRQ